MRLFLSSHYHWKVTCPPGKGSVSETGTSPAATSQQTASVPSAPALCGEQQERGSGKGCPWGAQELLSSGREQMACCCCSWAVMCQWLKPSVCLPRVSLPLNTVSPEFSLCFLQGLFRLTFQTLFVFFSHTSVVHITDKNTLGIGERQINLSAPWISSDISYSTIWSIAIKGPFFAGGTEGGPRKKRKKHCRLG